MGERKRREPHAPSRRWAQSCSPAPRRPRVRRPAALGLATKACTRHRTLGHLSHSLVLLSFRVLGIERSCPSSGLTIEVPVEPPMRRTVNS